MTGPIRRWMTGNTLRYSVTQKLVDHGLLSPGPVSGPKVARGVNRPRARAIRKAQGDDCYLCGGPFPRHDVDAMDAASPSLDHVRSRYHGNSLHRNTLIAHRVCNTRKGHRRPYPCELIYLDAVNLTVP